MANDIIPKVLEIVYPAELARRLTKHLHRTGQLPPEKPITRQNVHKRLNITGEIPPEWVLGIEAATGITRHDLRPDLYPRK